MVVKATWEVVTKATVPKAAGETAPVAVAVGAGAAVQMEMAMVVVTRVASSVAVAMVVEAEAGAPMAVDIKAVTKVASSVEARAEPYRTNSSSCMGRMAAAAAVPGEMGVAGSDKAKAATLGLVVVVVEVVVVMVEVAVVELDSVVVGLSGNARGVLDVAGTSSFYVNEAEARADFLPLALPLRHRHSPSAQPCTPLRPGLRK